MAIELFPDGLPPLTYELSEKAEENDTAMIRDWVVSQGIELEEWDLFEPYQQMLMIIRICQREIQDLKNQHSWGSEVYGELRARFRKELFEAQLAAQRNEYLLTQFLKKQK